MSITFNVIFHDVILSLQVLYKHLTNGSWQMQLTSHTCSEYHSLLDFYWKPRLYNFIDQPYIQTLAGLSNSFLTFLITIDLSQFLVLTSSISNWRPYWYCSVSFPLLLLFFFLWSSHKNASVISMKPIDFFSTKFVRNVSIFFCRHFRSRYI